VKLLFDQNISFRLVKKIESEYPGSGQVKRLALENSTDLELWDYARKNGYTIMTFDSDFRT
jgi:predicted nuclease of predicted toxin-antitoxin system